jgi:hypothetical protein
VLAKVDDAVKRGAGAVYVLVAQSADLKRRRFELDSQQVDFRLKIWELCDPPAPLRCTS